MRTLYILLGIGIGFILLQAIIYAQSDHYDCRYEPAYDVIICED